MEKRKAYYVSPKNWLTILSLILIFCAAMARFVLHKEGEAALFVSQILLPFLAEILFILAVLFFGKKHFYRTSLPVFLFCLAEMIAIARYPSVFQRLLLWLVTLFFAILYCQTITGVIHRKHDRALLVLFELLVLGVKLVPLFMTNNLRELPGIIKEESPSVLLYLGLLLLTLSIKEYRDGKRHPSWGDRSDGRRVRSLDPMSYVAVHIMPRRNGANVLFADTLDVTDIDKYIHRRRRVDLPHLTITQIYLAAYCRVVAEFPAVNRFISGEKIFSRDEDIIFNMMVKREMSVEGEETAIKLHLTPYDTIYTVSDKLDESIRQAKQPDESGFDKLASLINAIPGLLLKFFVLLLQLLDYCGFLPASILELSPFHGSIFFTSMASLGIPKVYHHLYDFGNMPAFMCLGTKYKKKIINADGEVEERKFMDFTVQVDERICDGFYYSRAFKCFRKYVTHPELLENPPEEVKHDAD